MNKEELEKDYCSKLDLEQIRIREIHLIQMESIDNMTYNLNEEVKKRYRLVSAIGATVLCLTATLGTVLYKANEEIEAIHAAKIQEVEDSKPKIKVYTNDEGKEVTELPAIQK